MYVLKTALILLISLITGLGSKFNDNDLSALQNAESVFFSIDGASEYDGEKHTTTNDAEPDGYRSVVFKLGNNIDAAINYNAESDGYRYIFEAKAKKQIYSKLIVKGNACNIWIDNEFAEYLTSREIDLLVENFDRIYSDMTEDIFSHRGSWGDIDGDGRINILLCDLYAAGTNGYYNKTDLRDIEDSNLLDIVFLDISEENGLKNLRESGGNKFFSIFAHEFQHMLSDIACNKGGDMSESNELWLNETMSELAACLYGAEYGIYFDESYFGYFLRDYGTYDGFFYRNGSGVNKKNYLMSALFGLYLNNKFDNAIGRIYSEYKKGFFGRQALQNVIGNDISVNQFFDGFVLASYFDGVMKKQSEIFSGNITYKGREYSNLLQLRKENSLLYLNANKNNGTINSGSFKYNDKLYAYDDKASKAQIEIKSISKDSVYWIELGVSIEEVSDLNPFGVQKIYGEKTAAGDTSLLFVLVIPKENKIEAVVTFIDDSASPNEPENDSERGFNRKDKIIVSLIMNTTLIALLTVSVYISKIRLFGRNNCGKRKS
jgi:hypothetical protein